MPSGRSGRTTSGIRSGSFFASAASRFWCAASTSSGFIASSFAPISSVLSELACLPDKRAASAHRIHSMASMLRRFRYKLLVQRQLLRVFLSLADLLQRAAPSGVVASMFGIGRWATAASARIKANVKIWQVSSQPPVFEESYHIRR